uniref:Uncharacterized protein n=1 Tax=Acrobeloides nanus TaxID=290746 RepID=A0A914CX13_9BILA
MFICALNKVCANSLTTFGPVRFSISQNCSSFLSVGPSTIANDRQHYFSALAERKIHGKEKPDLKPFFGIPNLYAKKEVNVDKDKAKKRAEEMFKWIDLDKLGKSTSEKPTNQAITDDLEKVHKEFNKVYYGTPEKPFVISIEDIDINDRGQCIVFYEEEPQRPYNEYNGFLKPHEIQMLLHKLEQIKKALETGVLKCKEKYEDKFTIGDDHYRLRWDPLSDYVTLDLRFIEKWTKEYLEIARLPYGANSKFKAKLVETMNEALKADGKLPAPKKIDRKLPSQRS